MNIKHSKDEENCILNKENKINVHEQLINLTLDINKKRELLNIKTIPLNNNEKDKKGQFFILF